VKNYNQSSKNKKLQKKGKRIPLSLVVKLR